MQNTKRNADPGIAVDSPSEEIKDGQNTRSCALRTQTDITESQQEARDRDCQCLYPSGRVCKGD